MFDPMDPNKGKRFLLRIIAAQAAGMTSEEFAEVEFERMQREKACPICGGDGTVLGLPCPNCTTYEDYADE